MKSDSRTRPLSHVLDGIAVATDLPPWDQQERALVRRAAQDLQEILILCQDPTVSSRIRELAEDALATLARWARGDLWENARHQAVIQHLRLAAGKLDGRGDGQGD